MARIGRRPLIAATLLLVLAAALVGAPAPRRVAKRAQAALERGLLIATGRLVDVGGYRLRIDRHGSGTPTVVFDAGLDQPMSTWGSVPSSVARFTRVVTYSRAGLDKSDPARGPFPRTSRDIVAELHILLVSARITPPYVLVGHSYGGLNVRLFASRYPGEVAGLVLIDASHEDQYARFAALKPFEEREAYLRHEGGQNLERVDLLASGEQVRAAGPLPAVPVVVLSAEPRLTASDVAAHLLREAQKDMQRRLARLAPGGTQIVVEGSDHFIQLSRPDAVVDAVRAVVEAARQRSARRRDRVGTVPAGR